MLGLSCLASIMNRKDFQPQDPFATDSRRCEYLGMICCLRQLQLAARTARTYSATDWPQFMKRFSAGRSCGWRSNREGRGPLAFGELTLRRLWILPRRVLSATFLA